MNGPQGMVETEPPRRFRGALAAVVAAAAIVLAVAAARGNGTAPTPEVHVAATDAAPDRVTVHLVLSHGGDDLQLAHYAEHLGWLSAVGGTPRAADRHSNAWVSHRAVGYWLSGSRADLPDLMATLARVLAPIDLPVEFAEAERGIILREYEFARANALDERVADAMDAALYAGNARAASLLGTPAEIAALDLNAARALHARTHRPGNATLVVTGDTTAREVRRAVRAVDWPDQGEGPARIAPPPFIPGPPEETVLRFADPPAAPRLVWRRVAALPEPVDFDLLEAEAALLGALLYSALPGGLAGPLRFDAAVARSFDIAVFPIDEQTVEVHFAAAPDAGVTLAALRDAFEATFAGTAAVGVPRASWDRVRSRSGGLWPDWEDADATARWMADYVVDRVSALLTPLAEEDLRGLETRLSHATAETILRALAGPGRTAVAFIGPEETLP